MNKNILLFHIAGLGDFIESLGVIKSIRNAYKDSRICLVVAQKVSPLAEKLDFIDKVYKWPTKKGQGFNIFKIWDYLFLLFKLKKYKFDIFINFHEIGSKRGSLMIKLLIKFIKPKFSVGRNTNHLGTFFNIKIEDNYKNKKNQYEYYSNIAEFIGVKIKYKNIDVIRDLIFKENESLNLTQIKKIISIGVGAERETRIWLPEYFSKVIEYLLSRNSNIDIMLLGNRQHFEFAEKILSLVKSNNKTKIKNFCGKTSLDELFYILKNSILVISNNSSVMHIAANIGINTIGIIGSGHPFRDRPYFEDEKKVFFLWQSVGCNPCYFYKCPYKKESFMKCMKVITPQRIIEYIQKIIL